MRTLEFLFQLTQPQLSVSKLLFGNELRLKAQVIFYNFFSFSSILDNTLIRRLVHFQAQILSYKHQQAVTITATIQHNLTTPLLEKHTLQNILKFHTSEFSIKKFETEIKAISIKQSYRCKY